MNIFLIIILWMIGAKLNMGYGYFIVLALDVFIKIIIAALKTNVDFNWK